MMILKEENEKV